MIDAVVVPLRLELLVPLPRPVTILKLLPWRICFLELLPCSSGLIADDNSIPGNFSEPDFDGKVKPYIWPGVSCCK